MAAVQSDGSWGLAWAGETFAVQLLCCDSAFFFPSCLTSHDCFIFNFFSLKCLPFSSAAGHGEVSSGRRSPAAQPRHHARGSRRSREQQGLGCPRLPAGSGRFTCHLKCSVSISYEPSVHLRHFCFLFCCIPCPCQARGKLCLRQDEKFGKNNPSGLVSDLWQTYFKQRICWQFPLLLVLIPATPNCTMASFTPDIQLVLQQSFFCTS